jgi:DNA modification methylase
VELVVTLTPIEKLIPYANNSRTHSDEQISLIASSIKEFGFNDPIAIDALHGIIAGHGRLAAARLLGLHEVPTIQLGHLTREQQKAYVLAHNRIALDAGWNKDLLKIELQELSDAGFDMAITGFSDDEMEAILKKDITLEPIEDETPSLPKEPPVTKLHDVWILGKHRVMCGDSTYPEDLDMLMVIDKNQNRGRANLCFTSPPYNVGKTSPNDNYQNKYESYDDDLSSDDYLSFLVAFTVNALSTADVVIVNLQQLAGNKISFIDYLQRFKENIIDVMIWDKGNAAPAFAENVLNSRFEYIILFTKKEKPTRAIPISRFRGTVDNVYCAPPQRHNEFSDLHAATFPLHLPEFIINTFDASKEGIILDVFGGTGTTLIAAERLERECRIMELDPQYVDVIVKRWQDFTKGTAILESTEMTFDQVKDERCKKLK